MATIIAEADAELALLDAEEAALDGKVVSGGPASWDFDVPHFDMAAGDFSDLASCCSDVGSEVHSVLANGPEALPLADEEALALHHTELSLHSCPHPSPSPSPIPPPLLLTDDDVVSCHTSTCSRPRARSDSLYDSYKACKSTSGAEVIGVDRERVVREEGWTGGREKHSGATPVSSPSCCADARPSDAHLSGGVPKSVESHVTMLLKIVWGPRNMVFKIKASSPLKVLMDAFCARASVESSAVVFLYDRNGSQVQPTDSAYDLGFISGSKIMVIPNVPYTLN